MHLAHLSLGNFRSYRTLELPLGPGVTTLVGLNGQGKTNIIEAVGYLATLGSHRVHQDAPLVRYADPGGGPAVMSPSDSAAAITDSEDAGADIPQDAVEGDGPDDTVESAAVTPVLVTQEPEPAPTSAIVRALAVRDGRETLVELEIIPGRSNRAQLNRTPVPRPREILGTVRTVLFAPEDLALVKGDPGERRRFLDELLVLRQPRWAGVRQDYDRIVKQRTALLKSAAPLLRKGSRGPRRDDGVSESESRESALHTLSVWDENLAQLGASLLYARLRLLRDLTPHLTDAYAAVSAAVGGASATYKSSVHEAMATRIAAGEVPEIAELGEAILASLAEVRAQEIERGVCLVGPHRDDLVLRLGELPAKGFASHGESWSIALGLRLASFRLLRHDLRDDPILILDDVFAELDTARRERLAELVADAEQVIVTAAVPADVPGRLAAPPALTYEVTRDHGLGRLSRVDA